MQQTGSNSLFCLQVESVLLLWKTENIFDMQQTGSNSFFACKLNLYCYGGKMKKYLTCNKQVPPVVFACKLNLYCYCGKMKKYLTCNKQVPPVVFACRLNLYCYCGKLKIFDMQQTGSTSCFCLQVESVLLLWKNEKYLTCNKQVPPVVFACRLNLYCYCGKLKIFDMQQTGSTSCFCLQVESVLLLWKIENI